MPAIKEELSRDCGNGNIIKVPISFDACKVTITKEIRFIQNGGTADEFKAFKQKVIDAFNSIFNGVFKLKMTPQGRDCRCPCDEVSISIEIKEVVTGGYPVTLKVGQSGGSETGQNGASIQENDRPGTAEGARACCYAHEFGHCVLGLKDEYSGNGANSPVHEDHSIMGNYHNEGYAEAGAKDRHFDFIRDWLQTKVPACCRVTLEKI